MLGSARMAAMTGRTAASKGLLDGSKGPETVATIFAGLSHQFKLDGSRIQAVAKTERISGTLPGSSEPSPKT